jgi:hypothetical protein
MILRSGLGLLFGALLLVGCDQTGTPGPITQPGAADPEMFVLIQLLEGSYRGPDATKREPGLDDLMTDTRIAVIVPALGENIVYWEVRSGADERAYRRVFMVLERNGSEIVQKSMRLRDGVEWPAQIGAFTFATLTAADFESALPAGCDSVWRRVENGFSGYLDPESCRVYSESQQMWRKIEAETIVLPEGLRQTERGFADTGEMLFGTPPGEYHILERL